MTNSVLEAIQRGEWNFEPQDVDRGKYHATEAMPGTDEKLAILAARIKEGLPLWHPSDRHSFDDHDQA